MTDPLSLGARAELGKVLTDEHADILREGVAMILREVMEMEVARLAGGERYERTDERATTAAAIGRGALTRGSGHWSARS